MPFDERKLFFCSMTRIIPSSLLLIIQQAGENIALRLAEAGESSESSDEQDEEEEEEGETDHHASLNSDELERRQETVRRLMAEELATGSGGGLNSFKVHGSEADWAKAIVGHGSDLNSLKVPVSTVTKQGKEKRWVWGTSVRGGG